jgi:RNA polymerase sigma-70 factor (ECF subfamily)
MQVLRSPPTAVDEAVLRRALAGDVQAFGDLYLACLPVIYRYIRFRLGDQALAQDLAETTFLRAWEARGRFRPGTTPVLGWLYRIARNAVIDHYRTARQTVALDSSMPAREVDVQDKAEENEERRRLAAALEQLDDVGRDVLTMRFVMEMSHAQVAAHLGRSQESIRVIQFRALRKLRARLQKGDGR